MAEADAPVDRLFTEQLSSFVDSLGLTFTEATGDGISADWVVTDDMLQPYGMLHGGVHCSVVETLASFGAALWLGSRGRVVGLSNSTDFFRICWPGDRLSSVCRPIHRGRLQQVWRVETTNAEGRLVSQGQVRIQNLLD